jgi:hypothetical protein
MIIIISTTLLKDSAGSCGSILLLRIEFLSDFFSIFVLLVRLLKTQDALQFLQSRRFPKEKFKNAITALDYNSQGVL